MIKWLIDPARPRLSTYDDSIVLSVHVDMLDKLLYILSLTSGMRLKPFGTLQQGIQSSIKGIHRIPKSLVFGPVLPILFFWNLTQKISHPAKHGAQVRFGKA